MLGGAAAAGQPGICRLQRGTPLATSLDSWSHGHAATNTRPAPNRVGISFLASLPPARLGQSYDEYEHVASHRIDQEPSGSAGPRTDGPTQGGGRRHPAC